MCACDEVTNQNLCVLFESFVIRMWNGVCLDAQACLENFDKVREYFVPRILLSWPLRFLTSQRLSPFHFPSFLTLSSPFLYSGRLFGISSTGAASKHSAH
jgi:hypothetical protein